MNHTYQVECDSFNHLLVDLEGQVNQDDLKERYSSEIEREMDMQDIPGIPGSPDRPYAIARQRRMR